MRYFIGIAVLLIAHVWYFTVRALFVGIENVSGWVVCKVDEAFARSFLHIDRRVK